uniref:Pre-mRNA 3'-end-processing endonuclease polyadenylation factor C-term domain-containing protein n=1 Tax=Glossina morsitans morsitans TaxID=37546 RepID=A0A1B0FAN2_GLOMM
MYLRKAIGNKLSGVLVKRDCKYHLLAASDLSKYTDMSMSVVTQRQSIPWNSSIVTLKLLLDRIGGAGTVEILEENKKLRAFACIDLIVEGKIIVMEWQATPVNDMYADTVLSCVMQNELGGTNTKGTNTQSKSDRTHFKECLLETLQDAFGESSVLPVTVAGKRVEVTLETLEASLGSPQLEAKRFCNCCCAVCWLCASPATVAAPGPGLGPELRSRGSICL